MKNGFILAVAIAVQPLVSDSVLEPSVRNEVDHALSVAPTNAPACTVTTDVFGTNGLSTAEIAVKLVSSQGPDGRWRSGTNDVTAAAVAILESL